VSGREVPVTAKWELLLVAEVTVTLPPVAVRVENWVEVWPRFTSPKLSPLGAMVSLPVVPAPEPPVPRRGMFVTGPEMNTLPPSNPDWTGVKVMCRVALSPLVSTRGNEGPLTEKPLP